MRIYTRQVMWSIEAVIARHEAGLSLTASERVVMEESTEAAAMGTEATPAACPMKVVAVAVDASEESLHALSWALDHVVLLHPGASLVVVNAQHPVDLAYGLAYIPPTAMDSIRRTRKENSREVVTHALDICKKKQVSATATVVEGDSKEAFCQAVEEMRADLLVLGSRGLGMVKRAVLDSVSDYLVHHACCPVLIVKPPNKVHHHKKNSTHTSVI